MTLYGREKKENIVDNFLWNEDININENIERISL